MMSGPKVLFVMADYGHDPTETSVPFHAFKDAGFDVQFATENGKSPECDKKMLEGWTGKILGAPQSAKDAYASMIQDKAVQSPHAWTAPEFSFEAYDLIFFPGGHDKGVRQALDSEAVRKHLAAFWPATLKPGKKAVGAVCHGVLVLSETMNAEGKSVLHDVTTTTLPNTFESGIFWATRPFLGDYYKTYGSCSENCEDMVKKRLDDPTQFKGSSAPGPFVVEDEKYNYVSGRYPADAQLLGEKLVALVRSLKA